MNQNHGNVLLLDLQLVDGFYGKREFESLGLASIAAYLRSTEVPVILELLTNADGYERKLEGFKNKGIRLVGMSVFSPTLDFFRDVCHMFKRMLPRVPIVTGGPFASYSGEELLANCMDVDYVIYGEGEVTMRELIQCIESCGDPTDCDGIYFRSNGEILRTDPRALVRNLDKFPFPSRDIILSKGRKRARISASRGCMYGCGFCAESQYWRDMSGSSLQWRSRSIPNVTDEIQSLLINNGIAYFDMNVDSCFEADGKAGPERLQKFADEIMGRELVVALSVNLRAGNVVNNAAMKSILTSFKKAGLALAYVGYESGVQEDLEFYRKGTTVHQNRMFAKTMKQLDIEVLSGFIMFNPFSTEESLQKNIRFLAEVQESWNFEHLWTHLDVFRGTPMANHEAYTVPWMRELRPEILDSRAREAFQQISVLGAAESVAKLAAFLLNWTWLLAMLEARYRTSPRVRGMLRCARAELRNLKNKVGEMNVRVVQRILDGGSAADFPNHCKVCMARAQSGINRAILSLLRAGEEHVVKDIRGLVY